MKYARELARATEAPARRKGVTPVTSASAATYVNGSHGKPSERTLKLLAAALDLPLWRLREAAGAPPGEAEPYTPPPEAARMNRRQRRAVDEIIRLLAGSPQLSEGSWTLGPGTEPAVEWVDDDQSGVAPPDRNSSATTDNAPDASSESTGNGVK